MEEGGNGRDGETVGLVPIFGRVVVSFDEWWPTSRIFSGGMGRLF